MVPARARRRSTPRRRPTVRHPPCQSPLPGPFPPERNPPPPPPPPALPPLPLPPPPPPLVPPPLVLPPPPGSTSTGAARQRARWMCWARCWRCQGRAPTCAALGVLPFRPPVTPPPTGRQPTRAYLGAACSLPPRLGRKHPGGHVLQRLRVLLLPGGVHAFLPVVMGEQELPPRVEGRRCGVKRGLDLVKTQERRPIGGVRAPRGHLLVRHCLGQSCPRPLGRLGRRRPGGGSRTRRV